MGLMKTKEEIEQLAEKHYTQITLSQRTAFKLGYNQCQEDMDGEILDELEKFALEYEKSMVDRKYGWEDLMNAFNAGINNDYGNGPSFDQWLNSLNKQD